MLALVAMATSCTIPLTYLQPKKKVVRHETREAPVFVRSVPTNATVRYKDGTVGTTPAQFMESYPVRLEHRERSILWPLVGLGTSIGLTGAVTIDALTSDSDDVTNLHWIGLGVGLADIVFGFVTAWSSGVAGHNREAKARATATAIPTDVEVELRWPNAPAQTATVTIPAQRTVTVARRNAGTFDEAIIHWAESGERTPSVIGLYNLGVAYAGRFKETGEARDAATAVQYLERYLGEAPDITPQRRSEVEDQLERLRKEP